MQDRRCRSGNVLYRIIYSTENISEINGSGRHDRGKDYAGESAEGFGNALFLSSSILFFAECFIRNFPNTDIR